jgi:uncharacterized protein YecE (DUF72 family)
LKEYLIGTGGWAYFNVPGLLSLASYSRAFNFVEVNSTFYQIPPLEEAKKWRQLVPSGFQFAVRAHRSVTQGKKLEPTQETLATFEKMKQICNILNTDILHIQIPASFQLTQARISELHNLVSAADLEKLRVALEIRGAQPSKLPVELLHVMQQCNMIHCTDVSKGEMPAYDSDILYSRLFGKGEHNIYQPTDEELAEIDNKVSNSNAQKIVMNFHFVRMYKDAARLKIYKQTGRFPKVTRSEGISSLEEVISEDATFPQTKEEIVRSQGWKLFDLGRDKRVHTRDFLQQLPEKTYNSVDEVIGSLKSAVK